MSTYLHVSTDAQDAPKEIPFSSAFRLMPSLGTQGYGSMDAQEFDTLLEDAILSLYRSREWAEYVLTGKRESDEYRLATTGFIAWHRSHPGAVERSLLGARELVRYALAHDARLAWG